MTGTEIVKPMSEEKMIPRGRVGVLSEDRAGSRGIIQKNNTKKIAPATGGLEELEYERTKLRGGIGGAQGFSTTRPNLGKEGLKRKRRGTPRHWERVFKMGGFRAGGLAKGVLTGN